MNEDVLTSKLAYDIKDMGLKEAITTHHKDKSPQQHFMQTSPERQLMQYGSAKESIYVAQDICPLRILSLVPHQIDIE